VSDRQPLKNYRILDLSRIWAGPYCTKLLADMGAEVLKVETRQRMDYMRLGRPIIGNEPDPEQHPLFHNVNRGKLSIALNTTKPEAIALIKELGSHCDVVIENFSPGVMDRLGLDYSVISGIKPEIVMASISSNGQTGPLRDLRAYAPSIGALSRLDSTMGYEGERPLGLKHAYADIAGALHSLYAIVSALHQKERTGQGQYIDESQSEAALHFLTPAYLDYTVNGRVPVACGNHDAELFPHGIFPTSGDDQWVGIAIRNDRDWDARCGVIERPDWVGRKAARSEASAREHTETIISRWTLSQTASRVESQLQALGIPAHRALDTPSLFEDPQLQHREHFIEVSHEIFPTTWVESTRLKLSETPARKPERAIHFGCDNREVLENLLDYTPAEIASLAAQGILT